MATPTKKRLAKDILLMAAAGGMPDSYWYSDRRVARALSVLGWTWQHARAYAYRNLR
jgi:hypothetical protein